MATLKSALGNNPLSKGIFNKTEDIDDSLINNQDSIKDNQDSLINNKDSIIKNDKKLFLENSEKERLNLRIPIVINDWLDNLLKQGKRKHGQKISKEVWLQAALELMMSMPIAWEEIQTEDELKDTLSNLESRIKKVET